MRKVFIFSLQRKEKVLKKTWYQQSIDKLSDWDLIFLSNFITGEVHRSDELVNDLRAINTSNFREVNDIIINFGHELEVGQTKLKQLNQLIRRRGTNPALELRKGKLYIVGNVVSEH